MESAGGVTEIEGFDDARAPWAAWNFNDHHWRIEGQWEPSILPEEIGEDIGACKVSVDEQVVLDMTISGKDREVMWIDALTVGPWVSDLLAFSGAQTSRRKRVQARSRRSKTRSGRTRSIGDWLMGRAPAIAEELR